MSSVVCFYGPDYGYFATDGAGTFDVDGQRYRYTNDLNKITIIDKNMILAITGGMGLHKDIKDNFLCSPEKTPKALQEIARRYADKYPEYEPCDPSKETLNKADIFLGKMEGKRFVLYQFCSRNNFDIVRTTAEPSTMGYASMGYATAEAGKKLTELLISGPTLSADKKLVQVYADLYNHLACQEIGGKLRVYVLDKRGIGLLYQGQIREPIGVKYLPIGQTFGINASLVNVGTINAGKANIISETGNLKIDGDGLKVFDAEDDLRVLLGSWLKGAIRKYGVKIVDGEIYATDIKTGAEGSNTYISLGKDNKLSIIYDGNKVLETMAQTNQGHLFFYDTGVLYGSIGAFSDKLRIESESSKGIYIQAPSNAKTQIYGGEIEMNAGTMFNFLGRYWNDFLPCYNNMGNLGSDSYKWNRVRAAFGVWDDICFEETSCAICGGKFEDGDALCLLTKTIGDDGCSYTIPIHERCKHISKTVVLPMPVTTKQYSLKSNGALEEHIVNAFEESEEEIFTLHPDYMLDEKTGHFKRRITEDNIKLFGMGNLEKGVIASRRAALARDIVRTQKPIFKDYTVHINGGDKAGV